MSKKKKKGSFGLIRILVLLIAIGVFGYSGYNLVTLGLEYKKGADEYSSLADQFTHRYEGEDDADSGPSGTAFNPIDEPEDGRTYEDAEPPIAVDWNELAKINSDIVGWIYVDALPTINYPICRAEDNDYYLHRTFRKEYLFSGAIFEDYMNEADFSDPNTVVYGHNMKDGSMFNTLKQLKDQAKYDADPYFWILTPKGNYRYHIYCVMDTAVNSDAYLLYRRGSDEFLKWEEQMKSSSMVKNDVEFASDDHSVILSTCTGNESVRCVVIGKCVSSEQPPEPHRPEPKEENTYEYDIDDIFVDPDLDF